MGKINQYFFGGCAAYTATSIILIVIQIIEHKEVFCVATYAGIIGIIILIQTILYFLENLQIKSQILHMVFELFMIIFITFSIGMPAKLVKIDSVYGAVEIIAIITLAYGITMLSLYLSSRSDAECINKRLKDMI